MGEEIKSDLTEKDPLLHRDGWIIETDRSGKVSYRLADPPLHPKKLLAWGMVLGVVVGVGWIASLLFPNLGEDAKSACRNYMIETYSSTLADLSHIPHFTLYVKAPDDFEPPEDHWYVMGHADKRDDAGELIHYGLFCWLTYDRGKWTIIKDNFFISSIE